jgi:hypothetical protein
MVITAGVGMELGIRGTLLGVLIIRIASRIIRTTSAGIDIILFIIRLFRAVFFRLGVQKSGEVLNSLGVGHHRDIILLEHIQLAQGWVTLSFGHKLLIFIIKKCLMRSCFHNMSCINSNLREMNVI